MASKTKSAKSSKFTKYTKSSKSSKSSKYVEPKFENRVRFNWGYHDAANALKNGWGTPERNFGFSVSMGVINGPEDVLKYHFDKAYAQGWAKGYADYQSGIYAGNSQNAWEECLAAGIVSE